MKKLISLLIILFIAFNSKGALNKESFAPSITIDEVRFQIDPRFEVFHIISYLADAPFINGFDLRYEKEIDSYFSEFRDHPYVSNFERLYKKSFHSADGPMKFILHCDYDFKPKIEFKNPARDSLAQIIRMFMNDSDFKRFFNNQTYFYNTILKTVKYNFQNFREKTRMEEYYRTTMDSYSIILNLLHAQGNYGIRIKNGNNYNAHVVIAPQNTYGNILEFSNSPHNYNLIWHEFSHTFVNPLVDEHSNEVQKHNHLYDTIKKSMSSQGYHHWNVTVKEHIVRAVTARLAADKYGEDAACLNHLRGELGRRFIYTPNIYNTLKEYEGSAESFEEFFPEILDVFNEVKDSEIDSLQAKVEKIREPDVNKIPTLNKEFSKKIKIIYPTNIENDEIRKNVKKYVLNFRDRYYPNKPVIADSLVKSSNVGNFDLFVFGSLDSNLLLSNQNFPFMIKNDKVVLDNEIKGSELQMLFSWINPYNKNKIMKVFTAQNPEDLIEVQGVRAGRSHYVLMDNNKKIKKGNFVRRMKIWFCE